MGPRPGAALLLLLFLTLGYLLKSLTAEIGCDNIYQNFSDCILKLGVNMASYEEEQKDMEEKNQALHTVCGIMLQMRGQTVYNGHYYMNYMKKYWDEFHSCAMTALLECQREAVTIWEMLRKESQKIKFQGSLFDLCTPTNSQNFSSVLIPTTFLLSITLMVTWFNL